MPWGVAVPGIDSEAGSPGAGSWGRLRDPGGACTEQEGVCPVGVRLAIHGIDSAAESPVTRIMGLGVGLARDRTRSRYGVHRAGWVDALHQGIAPSIFSEFWIIFDYS